MASHTQWVPKDRSGKTRKERHCFLPLMYAWLGKISLGLLPRSRRSDEIKEIWVFLWHELQKPLLLLPVTFLIHQWNLKQEVVSKGNSFQPKCASIYQTTHPFFINEVKIIAVLDTFTQMGKIYCVTSRYFQKPNPCNYILCLSHVHL